VPHSGQNLNGRSDWKPHVEQVGIRVSLGLRARAVHEDMVLGRARTILSAG